MTTTLQCCPHSSLTPPCVYKCMHGLRRRRGLPARYHDRELARTMLCAIVTKQLQVPNMTAGDRFGAPGESAGAPRQPHIQGLGLTRWEANHSPAHCGTVTASTLPQGPDVGHAAHVSLALSGRDLSWIASQTGKLAPSLCSVNRSDKHRPCGPRSTNLANGM